METGDSRAGRTYKQVWTNNMAQKREPTIRENVKTVDYTKVSFKPDLRKFGMECLDADIVALLTKRVYDIAGTSGGKYRVLLNGAEAPAKDFQAYVALYLRTKGQEEVPLPAITQAKSDRWEVVCSVSEGQFSQVSFVNSICTTKGGTHVDYIAAQIVAEIVKHITKKNKKT